MTDNFALTFFTASKKHNKRNRHAHSRAVPGSPLPLYQIGEERNVFKVFKEPEIMIMKEEDTEKFSGPQFLLCLDVN